MPILSSAGLPIDATTLPIFLQERTNPIGGTITIYPRYNNATANTFTFTAAGDYAPSAAAGGNAYYDFIYSCYPGHVQWYSEVFDNLAGRRSGSGSSFNDLSRYSLWINLSVGDSPHPSPSDYSSTRLAILQDSPGSYHSFQTTNSPTPNYSEPRCFMENVAAFQNFRVAGQEYGSGAYHSWRCLAHYQTATFANTTTIRIINLGGLDDGRSVIRIRGLLLLAHGRTGVS